MLRVKLLIWQMKDGAIVHVKSWENVLRRTEVWRQAVVVTRQVARFSLHTEKYGREVRSQATLNTTAPFSGRRPPASRVAVNTYVSVRATTCDSATMLPHAL